MVVRTGPLACLSLFSVVLKYTATLLYLNSKQYKWQLVGCELLIISLELVWWLTSLGANRAASDFSILPLKPSLRGWCVITVHILRCSQPSGRIFRNYSNVTVNVVKGEVTPASRVINVWPIFWSGNELLLLWLGCEPLTVKFMLVQWQAVQLMENRWDLKWISVGMCPNRDEKKKYKILIW